MPNSRNLIKGMGNMMSIQTKSITQIEMEEAIRKSGYLLEQRIEPIFEKKGYYAETNSAFFDTDHNKSREIDISALSGTKIYRVGLNFIFAQVLCECENNVQPLVFFKREDPISFLFYENVKCSGTPAKFFKGTDYFSLADFMGFDKFHHYCKGPHSTQYCSFQWVKDKQSWIACHNENQHNSFMTLIKAVEWSIDEHYRQWMPPKIGQKEDVNVMIYYPLLILQGKLLMASLKKDKIILREVNHIQYLKDYIKQSESNIYQIDVITGPYLNKYLNMIAKEMDKIKNQFQHKRPEVEKSIEILVAKAKKKRKKDSYRDIFEFKR
jgi:hypothetical protein